MTDLRQAAQQALKALGNSWTEPGNKQYELEKEAITALRTALEQQAEPVHGDIRALKYRIHELEGEVMGYKRMLDVAEAAPQRKPLTDRQVNECGMCGYVGKDTDKTGQCPKCRWDELRPLTGKAHQKPLTDDQIYEMYNEPRSDAEMLEFARAIEAAHNIKEGT